MTSEGKKTGGRAKGQINKKTKAQLERAETVLQFIEGDDNISLLADIKRLTPSQRVMLYSDMLEYVAPKLSRTTVVGDEANPLRFQHKIVHVHSPVPLANDEDQIQLTEK